MTNEEAIKELKYSYNENITDNEALDMAIKALEQEPCEDAISREQAIKQCGFGMTSLLIADCLRKLPPVNPQPKTGHWIDEWASEYKTCPIVVCSNCKCSGPLSYKDYYYCPNCGAKMVEPQTRK